MEMASQCVSADDEHKYSLIVQMMNGMSMNYLRKVFNVLKQLLSFDIISQLPTEIAKVVFSHLNAPTLCLASACCSKWREIASDNSLWHKLCLYQDFTKFSYLPPSSVSKPQYSEASSHGVRSGQWKQVYVRAHTLQHNWRRGRYSLPPLLKGHKKPVTTIACDDHILISGSADNSSKIWSLETCECLHVLEGHTDTVNEIALKGGIVVTACSDGLVRTYDAMNGQYIKSFHGHSGSVDHVACNGKVIISGGSDSLIKVWDMDTGTIRHTLSGHTDEIECIWLSEEGVMAVSGSWDGTLRVWNVETGICKQLLISHTEVVYCCDCVGWRIVSGGGDHTIKLWDMESGQVTNTLSGHTQEVVCIQCAPDVIASASADSMVRLWNYFGVCLHILDGHIGVVRCLSLRGDILVSGGDRKRIITWDVKSGKQLHTVHRQQTLLHRLCTTDTKIITASPDSPGTISIVKYW